MINTTYLEKLKGENIIVTGGAGFVGQNLVKALVNIYECNVTVVDDCSNGSEENLNEVSNKIKFYKVSVLDNKFFPLLKNKSFIFHLACKQISTSGMNPYEHLDVNGRSTLNILEYLRHNFNDNFKRLIYTSSCSIYGSTTHLPTNEEHPTHILSNYAATKLLGEHFALNYNRNYAIPVSIARYSNIFGYGQSPRNPYCGVLGKFIHNALTNEPLQIFGDGEQTRDYTFIDDAVNATILLAVHPLALGEVFNIGTSIETSVNSLAEIISAAVGNTIVENVPERDIDNVRRRSMDIEKIHLKLGWSPKINVKKGITETIKWYRTTLHE